MSTYIVVKQDVVLVARNELKDALAQAEAAARASPGKDVNVYQLARVFKATVTLSHFNADGSPVK